MLGPLRTDRRRTLLRLSLCSLAGTLVLVPLASPPALPARAGAGAALAPLPLPSSDDTPEPPIAIARDPFVPDAADVVRADAPGGANADPVVQAVALGASPRALVLVGNAGRIVRVGDPLGDSTVSAIDAHGILLQDGQALLLSEPK